MAAVAASPVTGGTAAAASNCSGTQINKREFYAIDGVKIGEVRLFWNSSTGNNCVITLKQGRTYGVASLTEAFLLRCENTSGTGCADYISPESPVDSRYDGDPYYRYYAGPVSVWARGHCVQWWGRIQDRDGRMYEQFVRSSNCGG